MRLQEPLMHFWRPRRNQPGNVVFILATTELPEIPAAILSRVQRFEFKSVGALEYPRHTFITCIRRKYQFWTRGCEIIARRAEGGIRDALSILDQALSLAQGEWHNYSYLWGDFEHH